MATVNYLCPDLWAFIQQIAFAVSRGYRFYVTGRIPEGKLTDAETIDHKIIARYGCDRSKVQKSRERKQGKAATMYLRWRNEFVILATPGGTPMHAHERDTRDVQKHAIRVGGHSIFSQRRQRPKKPTEFKLTVCIDRGAFVAVKNHLEEAAVKMGEKHLRAEIARVVFGRYQAWGGIVRQYRLLCNAVADRRAAAGLPAVQLPQFPKRRTVKVWGERPAAVVDETAEDAALTLLADAALADPRPRITLGAESAPTLEVEMRKFRALQAKLTRKARAAGIHTEEEAMRLLDDTPGDQHPEQR